MKIQYFAVLVMLVLYSCSENPATTAKVAESLPVVQLASGSAKTYQNYPAAVKGRDNVEIRPQVSGVLDQIFVDEGAFVTKGQPLFKINQAPFVEKLKNATASLHAAEGAQRNAQLEVDKLTPLVANKVIADYQLKTAQSALDIATANIEQAKSDIGTAKINLGYTLIKAPVSGYIGKLDRKQGSLVGPTDAASLTDLSDVQEVHVYFALSEFDFIQFKEQYAGRTLSDKIKQLPAVQLVMANDSLYERKGKIDLIDGQFDQNTGAIMVRATFPNPDGLLRSGNTGKVRLALQFSDQVIVPQAATIEMQDITYVYVVGKDNKVTKQPINIVGTSGTNYLVKQGLKSGDRIVFNGLDHLHDGDIIKPEEVKTPGATNLVANN